jgi:hypothetical protein
VAEQEVYHAGHDEPGEALGRYLENEALNAEHKSVILQIGYARHIQDKGDFLQYSNQ